MVVFSDPMLAQTLLESSVGKGSQPDLTATQWSALMVVAETKDENGATVYTSSSLSIAASMGWSWKAGLTADKYEISGKAGTMKENQWYQQCRQNSLDYASGVLVVGEAGAQAPGSETSLSGFQDPIEISIPWTVGGENGD